MNEMYDRDGIRLYHGDVLDRLRELPDESVHCVVTSPPYWGLRDYGVEGQIGLEATPEAFVARMVEVFREVRRVLRADGTCWVNMGDGYAGGGNGGGGSFAKDGIRAAKPGTDKNVPGRKGDRGCTSGLKPKDLIGMPWRVAFALQADGWWLRSEIIWHKPNPMPESCTDRPTSAHEKLFLLTKSARYFYDAEAVRRAAKGPVTKMPDGWDTGDGGHGSVHRAGREKGKRTDKQRGHIRRHEGFNDRWDGMDRAEQQAMGANLRNVWTIATKPFTEWAETVRQIRVEPDAPADGKKRKASPDCLVHGDHPDHPPSALCGEHEDDDPIHTGHSDSDPALGLPSDSVPIDQNPVDLIDGQSSGSPHPQYSPSATGHSSETHRTALDFSTSPPCMPSGETPGRTGGTSEIPASSAPNRGNGENRNGSDGLGGGRTHQTAGGIADKSIEPGSYAASEPPQCTCEWYVERTEKTSHFATFPPEMPARCIKAGCPEGGTVLDPFIGSGTTAVVAWQLGRECIGIDLSEEYLSKIAIPRIERETAQQRLFEGVG